MNPGPPEYEAGVLTTRLEHSALNVDLIKKYVSLSVVFYGLCNYPFSTD
jgi:hypothetical protein